MTTLDRSEFLGVYHNTSPSSQAEVPFRVAIKRNVPGSATDYTNYGYVKTEVAAAMVYNLYAVLRFGKGAILNDVQPTADDLSAYEDFINAKPLRRERQIESREKYKAVTAAGHTFRTHIKLREEQAQQAATQAEALAKANAEIPEGDASPILPAAAAA